MGARRPPNERPRRGGLKCEFCGRTVLSAEALNSHQAILHSQALKEKKKRLISSEQAIKVLKPEPRNVVTKKATAKSTPQSTKKASTEENSPKVVKAMLKAVSPKPKMDKPTDNIELKSPKPQETSKMPVKVYGTPSKMRHVEYKCPKCDRTFPVRFVALKHIQKHHCVNIKGEEVAPNSLDLIQPILYEMCLRCNLKFPTPHDCPFQPKHASAIWYECSECQQRFKNTVMFTKHIEEEHANLIHKMYFPLEEEFVKWKKQMECQTKCSYVIMQKVAKKQIYYCSEFMESGIGGHAQFCPSTIITNISSIKGLDVFFYPNHCGHKHKKYIVQGGQLPYTASDSSKKKEQSKDSSDDDDLYVQFKSLMDNIVLDAAKLKVGTLKTLFSKAMEMKTFVNEYDEDDDAIETISLLSNNSMTTISFNASKDEEINDLLKSRKRVIIEDGPSAKKKKGPAKKHNAFSLADDKDSDKILKELDDPNKITPRKLLKSPSFNDSYKEFIDKTSFVKNTRASVKKRNVVKTKMGIFKPSLSPKKEEKRTSVGKANDVEYEVREQENDCNILVLKI